ncbi:Aste57867_22018 [Aphanomyces stellatus]|uniref:Aste57867_22018 protein n=1 Tax=Aphanomyces stellatus TaxID=120398 RepID=A0A485LJ43_9STRA|nr:hypothetical protein As57867_021949 [Aphanomyces stellatus]VFT98686.1 Aste57867_22018 [Aphanomyces stellatus]
MATRAVADDILAADFLLVAVGAGFSADSGLPVYNDIANVEAYKTMGVEYHDLCEPHWAHDNLAIFYGFWGDCFNMYRDTQAHLGYEILRLWKQRLCAKNNDVLRPIMGQLAATQFAGHALPRVTTDPFFVYTSNVDAHFARYFAPNEIYEIHGNTETWQCAGADEATAPCEGTWQIPASFRFPVDELTMMCAVEPTPPFLQCPKCNAPARPNVLMFGDRQWLPNAMDERRYVLWEAAVEEALRLDPTKRLVILEIGCGTRVPSVRKECAMVMDDILEKTHASNHVQVRLVRINPDALDDDESESTHPAMLKVPSTGLAALEAVAKYMTEMAASD